MPPHDGPLTSAPVSVRLAVPHDREHVVTTIVGAFRRDPAFAYFFPDRSYYDVHAAAFAAALFDARVPEGTVWTVGEVDAVALWDGPAPGPRKPMDLPADALERLRVYNEVIHGALPSTPHWYLGVLATHPHAAGRGLGRATMAAGLAQAGDLPAYLETSNPVNVEMYGRARWTVESKLDVGDLPVWIMRYQG
jgi:GNAT superfamily N-acetyltransferase